MLLSLIRTPEKTTNFGSQAGSQQPQLPGDTRPQPAFISAAKRLIERRQATRRDGSMVPSKQRVAGSNPAWRATPVAMWTFEHIALGAKVLFWDYDARHKQ